MLFLLGKTREDFSLTNSGLSNGAEFQALTIYT
jgi:hypothetical protein